MFYILKNLYIILMRILTLEIIQPIRLCIMLGGQHSGIEENQNYDQPVECLRLHSLSTCSSHSSVDSEINDVNF